MTEELVLRRQEGAIVWLTLNAPKSLNALSDDMLAALHHALNAVAGDTSVRVVVLEATGKAFCAGHNLKEMTAGRAAEDGGAAYFADLFARCSAVMLAIRALPQPVIAQVHGVAAAAGCQLVASCDLALTSDAARFGVNGVNIGLFCSTPMVPLSRNIPRKKAFEILTTGDFLTAAEAEAYGLVNKVTAPEQLADETKAMAEKIASKLGRAVRIGKSAFYDQLEMPMEDAYAFAAEVMVTNMMEPDTAEGIDAFLAKRPPNYAQD